jgi:putative restriction endonuclease
MRSTSSKSKYGALWNREELVLAFELYCRIPFQKTKANNPAVKELAALLGRTSASVARKLGNFGAFDPALQRMHIKGLTHTSKLDRQVWDDFHSDWNGLVWEATQLRGRLGQVLAAEETVRLPDGPSERKRLTKQRVHQAFFREAVLSSYESTCCVTGLGIRDCLVASHIVPWSEDATFRADPTNGLCLSATFDRLFDAGLMSITTDFMIHFSSQILRPRDPVIRELICSYEGRAMRQPYRFLPSRERLEWHRRYRFQS